MILSDRIYGVMEIKEPVICDIIKTQEFQRLYGVSMGGWCPADPFHAWSVSRYEHSIGVFMLLRKYGATIEEQISGLIHDLNTPAFSHLCDYLFGTEEDQKTGGFQEHTWERFVRNSKTGQIIADHGFNLDYILDDRHFPLKENNLPDICADRIDYGLRVIDFMKRYGKLLWVDEVAMANMFIATGTEFICKNQSVAENFARVFNETDEQKYSSFDQLVYNLNMWRMFRDAIDSRIISEVDFFTLTDMQIVKKLYDADIDMSIIYENSKKSVPSSSQPSKVYFAKCRRIDPKFADNDGKIKKLSEVNPKYAEYMKKVPKYFEYEVAERQK